MYHSFKVYYLLTLAFGERTYFHLSFLSFSLPSFLPSFHLFHHLSPPPLHCESVVWRRRVQLVAAGNRNFALQIVGSQGIRATFISVPPIVAGLPGDKYTMKCFELNFSSAEGDGFVRLMRYVRQELGVRV
jgi:hypothetical protein